MPSHGPAPQNSKPLPSATGSAETGFGVQATTLVEASVIVATSATNFFMSWHSSSASAKKDCPTPKRGAVYSKWVIYWVTRTSALAPSTASIPCSSAMRMASSMRVSTILSSGTVRTTSPLTKI